MKKVEIKGFKSLAKKTVLALSDGVTCIAGPNGCGKSNLIDAIRWTLGEQSIRSLRAGSMSDVIFSGTQDEHPGSMAQVTLEFVRDGGYFPKTLDGFDEVSISRRLYRTGESVYSINGVKCRLKDITDLFLDTGLDRHGYAIIEQGKIKDIIQSRPEDIRYLIEEVAEVGKFRIKRAEAIKRLEATSSNLERIKDVLTEVSRQKDDLKAQANKAHRYQLVRSEINELTRNLWAHELHAIAAARTGIEQESLEVVRQIEAFEKQHQEYTRVLGSYSARLADAKEQIDAATKELNEVQSRMLLIQGDIDTNQERRKDIRATLDMLAARTEQTFSAMQESQQELEVVENALRTLSGEMEQLEGELAAGQEQEELLFRAYKVLEDDYSQGRAGLFDAIGQARAMEQRLSSMKTRYQEVLTNTRKRTDDLIEIKKKKKSFQERLGDLDGTLEDTRHAREAIESTLQTLGHETAALSTRIEEDVQSVVGMEKEYAQLGAKISMLERMIHSGAKDPGRTPASANGHRKVSDMLMVHAGFEEAVGRSMGESLDFVIIQDHEELRELLLKDQAGPGYIPKRPHLGGRVEHALPRGSGIIGPLCDCMEAQAGFEDVVSALSRDMWVVEDIHCALMLWNQGLRSCSFVTKDGMVLEPTGIVRTTAEMAKYAESLKAKAEKQQLTEQMHLLEGEITAAKERLAGLKARLVDLNREKSEHAAKGDGLNREMAKLSESRNETLRDLERIGERENSYVRDISGWEEMAEKLKDDLSDLSSQKELVDGQIEHNQALIKTLDDRKEAAKAVYEDARATIRNRTSRLNELKVAFASRGERSQGIRANLDKMRQETGKDHERVEGLRQTEASIGEALERAGAELSRLKKECSRLEEARGQLIPEFDELADTRRTLAESSDQCKETIDHLEKTRNSYLVRQKEQEIAYSMSLERLEARFGKGLPEVPESFRPEETREKVAVLGNRIERMGQINFASIDAYENVQARWDDLHRQYEDIVQAGTRLKEVISNIERQSTKAFMATFEKVKVNFQEIFTTIFGGGTADIVLMENEGMDSGVEILASPPFKRLKAMTLLSEGEKTLCALSFVFALFKVRPSPFCILDEVDAPLDDANVVRFNRLIRTFSQDSQFIIVTHNRYTMEMADIIYGVTFDVPGVSKVVSLVLQDMEG